MIPADFPALIRRDAAHNGATMALQQLRLCRDAWDKQGKLTTDDKAALATLAAEIERGR